MNVDIRQLVYDEWIDNSIYTVDRRNGRECVQISELNYSQQYTGLVEHPPLQTELSKRGVAMLVATTLISTCTVRKLQIKLEQKHNVKLSIGAIMKIKPFYVTYATEKEVVLCMRKDCLNMRMKFDVLMSYSKTKNGPLVTSISEYLMGNCGCKKKENGY